jgi:predicted metal-dependent hydrolase
MQFEYEVRHSTRAKRVRLAVKPDGRVILTLPSKVSTLRGLMFLDENREWVAKKLQALQARGVVDTEKQERDYREKKEIARKKIVPMVETWAQKMDLKYGRIAIKKTSSRWGSCSSKRNLNFHYRLAFIDEKLMEYVVIHELSHLVHMNHSKEFWKLVERWCPEWKVRRKELRKISTMSVG